MIRSGILAVSLALGTVVLLVAAAQPSPQPTAAPAAPGPFNVNEPIIVFSVTGGTLLGGVHRQLAVYNTGFVTISKFDTPAWPEPRELKDVRMTNIGSERAIRLLVDLIHGGAATLPDQGLIVFDVPQNTLTVLEGKEFAYSHTFSYWLGFAEYSRVHEVINEFIRNNFPEF